MPPLPDWNVGALPASVWSLLQRVAGIAATVPATVFGLATKHDVELQNRFTRRKTTAQLKELLEAQQEQLERLELMRLELREELESFAAAVNDQLFAIERSAPRRSLPRADFDLELDDELDDDLDLVSLDDLTDTDGDIDLTY